MKEKIQRLDVDLKNLLMYNQLNIYLKSKELIKWQLM